MISDVVNTFICIVLGWLIVNTVYIVYRRNLEEKGLRIYYGFILVCKKMYNFRKFYGNRVLRKLFYVAIIASIYGIFVYYSTMIVNIMAKAGLLTLPMKPKVLVPGIDILGIDLFYFAIAVLIAVSIHELAHALAAVSSKIKVKGLGFAIIFFIPIAFTEIDEKSFEEKNRKTKVTVLSAGPSANIVLAMLTILLLSVMVSSTGLVIIGVEKDGLAYKYGLKENSIIVEINNKPATLNILSKLLHQNKTTTIVLKVLEPNGTIVVINIVKPANMTRLGVLLTPMAPAKPLISLLGIHGSLILVNTIRWIYIVNMSLGVINIAPLFITDGARILGEIVRNNKVVNSISTITFLLLLTLFIP